MDWKKIAPWNWFKHEEGGEGVGSVRGDYAREADRLVAPRFEMERLFDDMLRRALPRMSDVPTSTSEAPALFRPSIDISEGKKAYTVRAELPGVASEEVSIEVEGNVLSIRAEKRQENAADDEGYHCIERSYGMAQRLLSLPDDADSEAIEARFKNGVLTLRIAKHPAPTSRSRRVEIQGE